LLTSEVSVFLIFLLIIPRHPRFTLFPTRRSSDLRIVMLVDGRWDVDVRSVDAALEVGARRKNLVLGAAVLPNEPAHVALAVHRQDRKSTRLNSSHLGISYAVFCLKKKSNQYIFPP